MSKMVEMAKRHRALDMVVSGHGYGEETSDGFKGCSVGCFAHDLGLNRDDHAGVADAFGIPEWAVRLQDEIFEGLPDDQQADFHVDWAKACSGVADWPDTLHRVHIAILNVAMKTAGEASPQVQAVIDLHEAREPKDSAAWIAARNAAWNTARSAARSVAWNATRIAARNAAWNTARSAARNATGNAEYVELRDDILKAMREVAS